MDFSDFLKKTKYLKELAEKGNTGTPKELAQQLNISKRSLYRTINTLKKMGYPIEYSRTRQSYYFKENKE